MEKKFWILVLPLISAFVIVTGLAIAFKTPLESVKINIIVLLGANLLLFLFSMLNIYSQSKNIHNPNPNAIIRGVMAGMALKLFGLAAAAIIYLFVSGAGRSVHAVFAGMGLYIVYTWLEVRISLQLKIKK
jgi:hypothetical protein